MGRRRTILCLICYVINSVIIYAQSPIGLEPPASDRGLMVGAAVGIRHLRNNVDDVRYRSYLERNFKMIVLGFELMSMQISKGENQYNLTDPDWLLDPTNLLSNS
ncbi:unnamed protein product [Adineta ricciae]|uniref:Uncharacterized protein n=1 Tax=Adineta ricciae TaxID=249248 RepID=A0A815H4A4_ADIRI|nr:unnamed protein product [Adineta ricciae]CAF1455301.1 unnamed protein product [Adineta ricciae]